MRKNIHPSYKKLKVECSCGNKFETRSTFNNSEDDKSQILKVEICSTCHPAYGNNSAKIIDTSGRVDKFNKRYGGLQTSLATNK